MISQLWRGNRRNDGIGLFVFVLGESGFLEVGVGSSQ
jgi:hypothetical protein